MAHSPSFPPGAAGEQCGGETEWLQCPWGCLAPPEGTGQAFHGAQSYRELHTGPWTVFPQLSSWTHTQLQPAWRFSTWGLQVQLFWCIFHYTWCFLVLIFDYFSLSLLRRLVLGPFKQCQQHWSQYLLCQNEMLFHIYRIHLSKLRLAQLCCDTVDLGIYWNGDFQLLDYRNSTFNNRQEYFWQLSFNSKVFHSRKWSRPVLCISAPGSEQETFQTLSTLQENVLLQTCSRCKGVISPTFPTQAWKRSYLWRNTMSEYWESWGTLMFIVKYLPSF